jgi:single-strand DNA-binding protein
MPNHASCVLIGHAGSDPKQRTAGDSVCASFSLAVNTGFGDRKKVTWWGIECWGKTGEAAMRFVKKGEAFGIEGEPYQDEYEKDGAKQKHLRVRAHRLILLGRGEVAAEPAPSEADTRVVQRAPAAIGGGAIGDEPPFQPLGEMG